MTQEELTLRIGKVFSKVFERQLQFAPQLSRLDQPRWTSLKHIEFMIALESEFDLRFDGADATDMTSIPMVVQILEQKLK
jgi:acyl carrier protein